ncbi:hypothetical protein [Corynebacterium heidelbergense]|uniref:Uncharacterized protein n=1 Tax=Corynebacterium heidelbergense TaxID=2055947 RepID=A0A364V8M0_9CORY|nr:hypothetical protein [Corynebacterium heidelbergense]RAV33013.1 hypothetical protein DLJ54_00635 [Corynebacterium heidelbergense]
MGRRDRVVRTPWDEIRRLARPPFKDVAVVALNALLACASWWIVPEGLRDWVFDYFRGRIGFAVVLGTWMLADTTTTNLLGNDVPSAVAALQSEISLARLLRTKALVLGGGIAAVTAAVGASLAAASSARNWIFLVGLSALPIGMVALFSLLGVALPHRTRTLEWRWRNRGRRLMTLRWVSLVLLPYLGVGVVVNAVLVALRALAKLVTVADDADRLGITGYLVLTVCCVAVSVAAYRLAPLLAERLVKHRRERLLRYLQDPTAG